MLPVSTKEGGIRSRAGFSGCEVWARPGPPTARLPSTDRSVCAAEPALPEDLLCSPCTEHLTTRVVARRLMRKRSETGSTQDPAGKRPRDRQQRRKAAGSPFLCLYCVRRLQDSAGTAFLKLLSLYEMHTVTIRILQVRKRRHREGEKLA